MSPSTDRDENSVSTSRETPIHLVSATDPVLRLPTRWSDSMKNSTLSSDLEGRTLSCQGLPNSGNRDAAAARTDNSIPRACGIYYYEVEILNKGTKGHIAIGFAGPQVKLSSLPGWEQNSWGYHGDDGMSFAADCADTRYGPTYGTGDIIGCGVEFNTHKAFYTINSSFIGYLFDSVGRDVDISPPLAFDTTMKLTDQLGPRPVQIRHSIPHTTSPLQHEARGGASWRSTELVLKTC